MPLLNVNLKDQKLIWIKTRISLAYLFQLLLNTTFFHCYIAYTKLLFIFQTFIYFVKVIMQIYKFADSWLHAVNNLMWKFIIILGYESLVLNYVVKQLKSIQPPL
jgi:hypothetical protein